MSLGTHLISRRSSTPIPDEPIVALLFALHKPRGRYRGTLAGLVVEGTLAAGTPSAGTPTAGTPTAGTTRRLAQIF